jgi:hypothetical protein
VPDRPHYHIVSEGQPDVVRIRSTPGAVRLLRRRLSAQGIQCRVIACSKCHRQGKPNEVENDARHDPERYVV